MSGKLDDISLPQILNRMFRQYLDGALKINYAGTVLTLIIRDQQIKTVSSDSGNDILADFLEKAGLLEHPVRCQAEKVMNEESVRFGKAMMKIGAWGPGEMWKMVRLHMETLLWDAFSAGSGQYEIETDWDFTTESICLDIPLPEAVARGVRQMNARDIIAREMAEVTRVYAFHSKNSEQVKLLPFEEYVFKLAGNENEITKIIESSELLQEDTLKILFMLLSIDKLSTCEPDQVEIEKKEVKLVNSGTFNSFEEALKYYNLKYEMIFRVLSKEIGPIALSILSRAIDGISENLPPYMRKINLRTNGSIVEAGILKSVWYHDFEKYIAEFLRGLEEILYAEIYAVKKHLGLEYEQQILKWLNRMGS